MTDRELHVFAATLWGEARGEGTEGMAGVAHVILNRKARTGWPDTVARVCLQPKQFSMWNDSDPQRPQATLVGPEDSAYLKALYVAAGCLVGEISDPTGSADHYHADYIDPPPWTRNMQHTVTIGRHLFYRSSVPDEERF